VSVDALDFGGSIPTISGATILLVIIGVLGRLWLGAEARHLTELARVNKAHDEEIAERKQDVVQLKADLAELRARIDELTKQVDTERRARWHAEDVAAAARRQGGERHAT